MARSSRLGSGSSTNYCPGAGNGRRRPALGFIDGGENEQGQEIFIVKGNDCGNGYLNPADVDFVFPLWVSDEVFLCKYTAGPGGNFCSISDCE